MNGSVDRVIVIDGNNKRMDNDACKRLPILFLYGSCNYLIL